MSDFLPYAHFADYTGSREYEVAARKSGKNVGFRVHAASSAHAVRRVERVAGYEVTSINRTA